MARPVEFERDQALTQAVGLFWRQGYQAASLPDLTTGMGISRSSLYAAFGDKRALFIECLDLYARRTLGLLAAARAEHPPLEALRQFFERSFGQPGCLLVNTTLEMADVDDGLSAHAVARLAEVEAGFEACLREAGCDAVQAAELAAVLMLVNQGLRVSSRRNLSADDLKAQLDTTFRILAAAIPAPGPATPSSGMPS
ncbi:TetR/AcrR family transcriptional regulator [Phenylobacterium aquaticum]|uniref:TetR/AcrR family transcriptional regulator n=1 Tax=Phenylobacterium aquaticum TaxID=1763816 RepID=UPI001F5C8C8F|nr:TetR/AcrR family transcriptional regulator [Phenylobacterium aquaticum]MCI3134293.1 TetR/AcrR family transcriptional regulator [Phenylobacterium aquaticum]